MQAEPAGAMLSLPTCPVSRLKCLEPKYQNLRRFSYEFLPAVSVMYNSLLIIWVFRSNLLFIVVQLLDKVINNIMVSKLMLLMQVESPMLCAVIDQADDDGLVPIPDQ